MFTFKKIVAFIPFILAIAGFYLTRDNKEMHNMLSVISREADRQAQRREFKARMPKSAW